MARYSGHRVGKEPAVIARLISTSDQIAMGTVAYRNSGSLKVGTYARRTMTAALALLEKLAIGGVHDGTGE